MAASHTLERHEYKFLAPMSVVAKVRTSLAGVCRRDPYAGPAGSYPIRSLYLDNWNLDLYNANNQERATRFKARVRGYPARRGAVFLEIKRRFGDVIVKSRGYMAEEGWAERLRPAAPGVHEPSPLTDFYREVVVHDLQPKLLVEYEREAWMSELEPYARVTFDQDIRAQEQRSWSLEADPGAWRTIDHPVQTTTQGPVCVIELKFENDPPRWMQAIVRRCDLIRYSFSKYCYGMTAHLPGERPRVGDRVSPWGAA